MLTVKVTFSTIAYKQTNHQLVFFFLAVKININSPSKNEDQKVISCLLKVKPQLPNNEHIIYLCFWAFCCASCFNVNYGRSTLSQVIAVLCLSEFYHYKCKAPWCLFIKGAINALEMSQRTWIQSVTELKPVITKTSGTDERGRGRQTSPGWQETGGSKVIYPEDLGTGSKWPVSCL